MAHPYFETERYPWHREEAQHFHRQLYTAFKLQPEISLLMNSCGPGLTPIAPGAADIMWTEVLDRLAAAQLLRRLGELLRERNFPFVNTAFKALEDAEDPVEAAGVSDGPIFVNRVNLRDALKRLAQPKAAQKVLLIRGERGSGKTYSREIVFRQAESLGINCAYLCAGLVATAEDVLDQIFAELGGGGLPDVQTTDEAWFKTACTSMLRRAEERNRGAWIVADDLGLIDGVPALDPRIRALFDQMALNMLKPTFAKWFRLVLIDYPEGPVPTRWKKSSWEEDRLRVADINESEIGDFLLRWTKYHGKALAAEDAAKLAHEAIARVDAKKVPDAQRLETINDDLNLLLTNL
ncbi:hypothetical protein [Burkholderia sp. Ac-20365]|uniref:hypothetical protein n=1 Tax=Burkholderia sp. Ac-20365 TaxID=2703897 RepID=UPI00197B0B6F|nr:hypothetical protein [Burkholderia sp. Ac-20365]MBN3760773.1 hypothetical protein [Burkholderia sp. Ac-20365]